VTTVVLVHSPLVGPLTWRAAANHLRQRGYRVAVPSLAGVAADGPPYYRRFGDAAARGLDGETPVVLVGHSGAGALLPGIAEVLPGRVGAAVFVDAMLPHPGLSWFDAAPEGLREQLLGLVRDAALPPWHEWLPPGTVEALLPDPGVRERFVAELPRVPVAYFEESAPTVAGWDSVRCAYVRLSEAYDGAADKARHSGWWVRRENADHLAMLTRPDTVAASIAAAIGAITQAAG
jgi:pimeloyl-ACP methyl ester carboxylesterase